MKNPIIAIAVAVLLLPMGKPLVIGIGAILTSSMVVISFPESVKADSSEFIYKSGYQKLISEDYYGAIKEFTKFINRYPSNINFSGAYYNRGLSKRKLGDNYGAISDYSKAIEINPRYSKAYMNRGNAKSALEDYYGAISDYSKAIKIKANDPNDVLAYANRGIAKQRISDMKGACSDWRMASSLGDEEASNWVRKQC